ncbi:hypothetical protein MKD41_00295 [Lutibacter sp. A64]|uniref:hypothetical protein n=1 Tax=Lutibacter sp. A64 TaxID=2918526 RepID=UPI001F0571C4|nr:hypothetical protein [Lutibacter sp. A64]UMB53937.1 hypothetical protein MKD41_00295 [Lutibacter sp. A64]
MKYSKKEITLEKAKLLKYQTCSVCTPTSSKINSLTKTTKSTNTRKNTTTSKRAVAVLYSGKTKLGARSKRNRNNKW